ncbi:MAG TPA: pyridoxamine 5'-phosphate oxidase family protein [Aeromicrobium sp.]|nr:pyridoxamine 5'-phosphate oxidase family protein [Aeromicrobium sp.]
MTITPEHLSATPRTRHRRMRDQGRSERSELHAVLDAGFVCHLGVIIDGAPMVIPTAYGYTPEWLYLHGSVASQSLVTAPGSVVCATVTHIDGMVLARSVFEHGVNYRSAMIYGVPRLVTDAIEKEAGLQVLTEHIAPGQWDYARRPSPKELAATSLLAISLGEASVKIRSGPPTDGDSPDAQLDIWAGVIPMSTRRHQPLADPLLTSGIPLPDHIRRLSDLS